MHLPLQAMFAVESWEDHLRRSVSGEFPYTFELYDYDVLGVFSIGAFSFIIGIAIIFFACLLIGVERNTRRMDFTFSLPFTRKDIFLAKWFYGILLIITFHSLSFVVAYWIVRQSEFAYALTMVSSNQIFFGPIVGFIVLFSFALFIGTFTGEMISQIALTVVFSIFPMGFAFLITYSLDIHYITSFRLPEWIKHLTVVY